jgi:predicted dinucleotide-binding enzyme
MVGSTIATKLVKLGHEVKMGSRTPDNAKAAEWVKAAGGKASQGTYAEAAAFGELAFNCTAGTGSLAALEAAGKKNLAGKILIDVSNPLDFSKGMPPTLTICNTDSLGEQIQRRFPKAKVVKTLNTVNASVMVAPAQVAGGDHTVFVSGNDAGAKQAVTKLLVTFGWKDIIDLGDITSARATEMILPLWLRLWGALGSPTFNLRIVR